MWQKGWREEIWNNLDQAWDVIVVGGGITGAGVLRQAVNAGLKTLLVEANDFASGTSSRSSKMVHGGFRYLRNRQYQVTQESVREREWLLHEAPHLVTPLSFLLPDYASYKIPMGEFGIGVVLYDLLAPKWQHHRRNIEQLLEDSPGLRRDGLMGGYEYYDAAMDDARLVIRVLREAVQAGGTALNYARAEQLLRTQDGQVCGVALRDVVVPDGKTVEVNARVVINAAGPWSDELRAQLGAPGHIRKLRGSHIIFSCERFPTPQAVTLFHPRDRRALFVLPWEGTTMVGTTDLDHPAEWEHEYSEPFATQAEIDYLLEAANFLFPLLDLKQTDIVSSFAGLRPTIQAAEGDAPSKVSRAHALYQENGLITITGGKYTTFRLMSRQAVETALAQLGQGPLPKKRLFNRLPETAARPNEIKIASLNYLYGRHGNETADLLAAAQAGDMQCIEPLSNVWAELRWAARDEGVQHLSDLLLRRVRMGMLLPNGAQALMPRIRSIVQPEMGWDDARWDKEEASYQQTWKKYYSSQPG
ncbi:MAG: glycerol-3-phosphate dehydrogenase/oxidase [Anaerolineaceae bacterium]|jgi:glycerol-3-phosphate dehydrogenase